MSAIIPFPEISPEIFSISLGPLSLSLRWYSLAYIAGLLLAWRSIIAMVRRPHLWQNDTAPLSPKNVEELLTWVITGVILGGRLGFVLFYQPAYYLAHPGEILMVWNGGMSFHGGFVGVIAAGAIYGRKHRLSIASIGDCFAATVAFGLFFGRVANFINAELWGRVTTVPWAVPFPGDYAQTCPPDWVGVCTRHPSQLYEAGLEGLLLGLLMFWLVSRKGWLKTPGALVGVFFIIYGVSRSFVELFRQPDLQFQTLENPFGYALQFSETAGLTMGQILSLPMVAIGLFILWQTRFRRISDQS